MRRAALSEWGTIVASALSLTLFFYWAISATWHIADFELFLPLGHWKTTQVLASGGTITVSDRYGSLESLEFIENATFLTPLPTGKYRWSLPGFRFRCVTWTSNPPIWSVDFSLLIPTFLTAIVAALCLRRYCRLRRGATVCHGRPSRVPDRAEAHCPAINPPTCLLDQADEAIAPSLDHSGRLKSLLPWRCDSVRG
jgi:hypothetical protein